MKNTSCGFGYGRFGILLSMAVLLSAMFPAKALLAGQELVACPPLAGALGVDKCELSEAKLIQQSLSGCVDKTAKTDVVQKVQKLHMPFIANNGQTDERVKFYANTFGGTVFITKEGEIVYSLNGDGASRIALKETLIGGKVRGVTGKDTTITNVNYFKGKDPSQWKTGITTYDAITLGEVYKGIELKLKAYGDNVEKLFCVKPGASPDQIQVQLNGGKSLKINDEGQLVAETELGPVKFTKPVAYQEINGKRVDVSVEYRVESSEAENKSSKRKTCNSRLMSINPKSTIQNLSPTEIGDPKLEYGFKVASYDKTKDLVIDPLLASTYVGGSNYDRALSIAIDTSSNVYVGGSTISSNFPTTTSVYDTSFNGGASDAFLLKFDSDLNNLLASTYLGGTKDDYIYSIVIDTGGNIYMCGSTGSSDFPTTTGAYDTSINNGSNYYDGFVSKMDSGLTSLLASTYLGGSNSDHPRSITKDSGGNIYVSGLTYSSDFPVTTGAYDTSFNGGVIDAFISKLNGTLATLLSSTYLGGSGSELQSLDSHVPSLSMDTSGNILVTGTTYSSDFPTTPGAYDTSRGGDRDAFVSKISGDLTNLLASTYLGGSIYDEGYSIAGDSSGNIYVVGYTYSSDFPTTTGAYDTSYNNGNDAFVSKFNGSLTGLLASTYLGGSNGDEANDLVIDSNGNIYIAGFTDSSEFPTTANAYDTSRGGATDAFISKFNGALTSLLASTYLGGSGIGDVCYSLAIDSGGNIYATGYTKSSDFPTTTGAYDTSYNDSSGSYDVFVSKLDSNLSATPSDTTAPSGSISINSGASYTNSTTVTLNLSATDSVGVTGYYISDSSTTPSSSASGWTSVTSTTSYSGSVSYSLSGGEGSKTIYAWYKDAAGNVSSTANATITLDTTVPTVAISSPTSDSTYTATSSTISLGGSASDSSSGISSVAWSNSRGGNGTATGTASWTVSSISLSTGDNVITVTAKDGANNSGTDTVQVTYGTTTSSTTTTTTTTTTSSTTSTTSPTATTSTTSTTTTLPTTTTSSSTTTTQPGSSTTSTTSSTTTTTSSTTTTTLPQPPTPNPTITPAASPSPAPTLPPLPTPQVSPSPVNNGIVFGFVNDEDEQPLEGVTVTITGPENQVTETDENGYYEFSGLDAGGYAITYEKEGFLAQTMDISLEQGEVKDLGIVTMEQTVSGKIYGYVVNIKGSPIEFVKLKLKGVKTKVTQTASSDADGFFEFADLEADTYVIVAKKKKYRNTQQKVKLGDGESKEIEIVMKKTSKRIIERQTEEG